MQAQVPSVKPSEALMSTLLMRLQFGVQFMSCPSQLYGLLQIHVEKFPVDAVRFVFEILLQFMLHYNSV